MRIAVRVVVVLVGVGFGSLLAAPVPPPDNRAAEEALKEAVAALDKLQGRVGERAGLWCAVAELHRKLGNPGAARDALIKARTLLEARKATQGYDWATIARVHARLDDVKAVVDFANAIPVKGKALAKAVPPGTRILEESALVAADAGRAETAREIADAIPDEPARDRVRADVRRHLLIHQARTGDAAGAVRGANELPTAWERLSALVGMVMLYPAYHDRDIGDEVGIASVQMEAGNRAGAKETALKALALLPDIPEKQRAVPALTVFRVLTRLDDLPAANKALAHIAMKSDPPLPGGDMIGLLVKSYQAAAEVRAGRDDAAKALAAGFKPKDEQAYILQVIGLAQSRAGRKEAAVATFARAAALLDETKDELGATTWYNLASAQALAGDTEGALKSAGSCTSSSRLWQNVAACLVSAGDFAAARKVLADHIDEIRTLDLAPVHQSVASRQAYAGQAAAVGEWAAKEEDPLLKAAILVGRAEGLYREIPKPRK